MKRFLSALLSLIMVFSMLVGCSSGSKNNTADTTPTINPPESDVAMQYISIEDAVAALDDDSYIFFDVRKAEDHETSHIPGAEGHDMDAAKNGDFQAGVSVMQNAIKNLDKNIVIICYSGKSYAQATTNVLSALGYDMSKVFTLEGGYKAWTEAHPDMVELGQKIEEPANDVEMQYISVEDAVKVLEDDSYVFFDVRKDADYQISTIPGAQGHDMDAAKEGDFKAGVATMQVATRGLDKNIILVCYSGKRYAQATTNVLSALGYDMSKVFTLEGGFTAWSKAHPELMQLGETVVQPAKDVEMQYISVEDAAKVINDENYVFFDVRKTEDYQAATIPGAQGHDMDAAKEGDFNAGVATMQAAIRNLDKNIIVICYSGKRYAQATTNVLSALGYDMSKVYTLEGGFNAWSEADPLKPTGTMKVVATSEAYVDLFKKFTAETGVKVELLSMSSGEVLSKLRAEGGTPSADLWFGGGIDAFMSAKEDGLLAPVKFAAASDLNPLFVDADGYWFSKGITIVGFLINNSIAKELGMEIPQTWQDLLDEQYKGEIIMSNPAISGTNYAVVNSLLQAMGEDKGWDYFETLNENIAYYSRRGADPKNKVTADEFAVGITYVDRTIEALLEDYDVTIVYPTDGMPWVPEGVAAFKNADNTIAATYFIEWLFSNDDNLRLLAEIDQKDGIKSIKPSLEGVELGYDSSILLDLDLSKFGSERETILAQFEALMGDKAITE